MSNTENRKHDPFTISDVLSKKPAGYSEADLITIANDLANHFKFKRVTRDGFRNATQISDASWARYFGSFPAFMEAAGLNNTAQTRKVTSAIARHSRQDFIRTVSEERLTWGTAYVKPDTGTRFKTLMAASDFHDKEVDEFALRMFVEACSQVQPDVICLNGDLFDLPEFSRHIKDPREWDVVGRMNKALDIVHQIRLASPKSQIDLIEGNHEARMVKFLMDGGSGLMDILHDVHGMDMRKLFRLDEYEVNYIAMGELQAFTDAQLRKAVLSSEKIYWNFILARHHPPTKKHPALFPGFNGHHHQHLVDTRWNHRMGSYEWHQTGGMHKRQASYTEGRKWNCGFLYGVADTKYERINWQYTFVGDTGCQMGAQFYERHKDEYYPGLLGEIDGFIRK